MSAPFDKAYPPSVFEMFETVKRRRSSQPFCTATSAIAKPNSQGFTIAAVGAHKAPFVFSVTFGSFSRTLSASQISNPGTPFSTPRSKSFCNVSISSSHKAKTNEPVSFQDTLSFLQISLLIALPSTLSFAISVPGSGSYPACIIALFARVAPIQMSFSFSNNTTRRLQRDKR